LNWGTLSQATDNVALLPDLSGTIIESNAVMFEGANFNLHAKGLSGSERGLTHAVWGTFLQCDTVKLGIGADCNGVPYNAVRYDSPTFGGFSMSSSWGEDDTWDVALKYAADWNSFKVSAAAGYTASSDERSVVAGGGLAGFHQDSQLFQVGASALHVPSGLFVYGLYQNENANPTPNFFTSQATQGFSMVGASTQNNTNVYYLKAGIKRTWTPLGATVLFGEWAQYQGQDGGIQSLDACAAGGWLTPLGKSAGTAQACATSATGSAFITDSTVNRWGLGVVQEIDSAAMHVYARWQHLDLDVNLVDAPHGSNLNQNFDSWDVFAVGGVIFF
jgi:hypothetical protein